MGYFDSHTHIESQRYDSDRDEVIARAASADIAYLVTCGADLATSRREIELVARYRSHGFDGIYAAVGVHAHEALSLLRTGPAPPTTAPQIDEDLVSELAALCQQDGVVALGEIGLDYHYDFAPRETQRQVLARQVSLAADLGLPVILHNRESDQDLRQVVDSSSSPVRGVLHCFLGDEAMADWALARGLYLGIAGPITFGSMEKRSPEFIDLVRRLPLDRLLIETDCPYLAPEPMRGRRNEPAYVTHVAARLAELKGVPVREIAERTGANACHLFGIA